MSNNRLNLLGSLNRTIDRIQEAEIAAAHMLYHARKQDIVASSFRDIVDNLERTRLKAIKHLDRLRESI